MLTIRITVLAAVIGVSLLIATLAQVDSKPAGIVSVNSDEPILNAPYSAKRRFTSVTKEADGTTSRIKSGGSEARDSRGRAYSADERQWTYFDGKKNVLKSEMLYRVDDPVANTQKRWDTTSKVVKVIHWAHSASSEDASAAKCSAAILGDLRLVLFLCRMEAVSLTAALSSAYATWIAEVAVPGLRQSCRRSPVCPHELTSSRSQTPRHQPCFPSLSGRTLSSVPAEVVPLAGGDAALSFSEGMRLMALVPRQLNELTDCG